jgi:uncharacterized membrane protein
MAYDRDSNPIHNVFMQKIILSQSILWAAAILATAISKDASISVPLIAVCATIAISMLQQEIKKLKTDR